MGSSGEDDVCVGFVSAVNLCFSQIQFAVLNAACEMKVFEIIASANGRHVSASEVASRLPTSSQHKDLVFRLDRMLRLLANHELLTCSYGEHETERLYGLSAAGKLFAGGEHSDTGFMASYPSFVAHPALMPVWLNFKDAIIDKDTDLFKKVHGIPMYQYTKKDPSLNSLFNKVMGNLSDFEIRKIVEMYKGFDGISTLVDVGGGIGQNLKLILSKYPSIKGINFDLPHAVQTAPPHSGIEHVGGDMFVSVPKGDAIILKNVLHNWSDEDCIKVLKNAYEALPKNGKVMVMEFIMPEGVDASEEAKFVSGLDSFMFVHDGRERTEKEYQSLCNLSGFSAFKVACRAFHIFGVMEFYK